MATTEDVSDTDVPSDFFDDFNKDEFMQGLSVVDSWDDNGKRPTKIDVDAVERVGNPRKRMQDKSKDSRKSPSFIKPGSRRDPNKTNAAIKRDKEAKVKDYLAKSLVDDLRPPGTELDDYFDDTKSLERKRSFKEEPPLRHSPKLKSRHSSKEKPPSNKTYTAEFISRRSPRNCTSTSTRKQTSTYQSSRRKSPVPSKSHSRWSPRHSSPRRFSPRHLSPRNLSPRRLSPRRLSPRWRLSPRRLSPRHLSPHHSRYSLQSRSPERRSRRSRSRSHHYPRRSRSRSSNRHLRRSPLRESQTQFDDFLYPNNSEFSFNSSPMLPIGYPSSGPTYPGPVSNVYVATPGYSYPTYNDPYSAPPLMAPMPQPVPAPMPLLSAPVVPVPEPASQPPTPTANMSLDNTAPLDPLAQLLAEGKISHEDYLKLTPNKVPGSNKHLDDVTRVEVMKRCNVILGKLDKLTLPNKLVMNTTMVGPEPKTIQPKYCSPLKRMMPIEFHFTKTNGSTTQHNRQLVNSIIAAVGLDHEILKPKKKQRKNMRDACVQTSKPFCDICELRESTKCNDVGTHIDLEHFAVSVHTQVVEHELNSTKAVFSSSGGTRDGAPPISLAHLTPAQLVSQLAARAKTLQQTEPSSQPQYSRRPQNSNYDYDNRGGGSGGYGQYNNYRY